jgi:transposase
VYHVLESNYDTNKKYNTDKRISIGKMVDGSKTKMIPNDRFELYYPELLAASMELPTPPLYSQTMHVGAVVAQRQIARDLGLTDILISIYGENIANEIISVISFVLTEESAVFQHYPDFMRNHLPTQLGIRSDSYISSKLLHQYICDERIIEMLHRWNRLNVDDEKIYIGCDSTNFNSEAENICLAELGAAKDDPTKPQVNLAVAVSQKDSTPLYYDLFPGSIIDLTECEQLVDQLHTFGYRNVGLLFDRGYFSEPNVRKLDSLGFDFMMMLREDQNLVKGLIKKHAASIKDHPDTYLSTLDVYGITVPDSLYDNMRYFHIYYDEVKASYAKRRFLNSLSMLRCDLDDLVGKTVRKNANLKKHKAWFELDIDQTTRILKSYALKESKINEVMLLAGFFVIMTSEKMGSAKTLETYRGRDNIEKFFRGIKSGMDFDSPGVHDDHSLAAKIHLMFIAGIIRNRFVLASQAIRKNTGNKKSYTVPTMIDQLEQIECTAYENNVYQRRYAFTAKQKLIMENLNIDSSVIDSEIGAFNSFHPLG